METQALIWSSSLLPTRENQAGNKSLLFRLDGGTGSWGLLIGGITWYRIFIQNGTVRASARVLATFLKDASYPGLLGFTLWTRPEKLRATSERLRRILS